MGNVTCIVLLRGVNVGGRNMVRMESLRALLERSGYPGCRTHLQSGNAILKVPASRVAGLAEVVQKAIQDEFGLSIVVMVLTRNELGLAISGNPFLRENDVDPDKLHLAVLSAAPVSANLAALPAVAPERVQLVGRFLYLYCPNGLAKTKLTTDAIERRLGVSATVRNWRTTNALFSMSENH